MKLHFSRLACVSRSFSPDPVLTFSKESMTIYWNVSPVWTDQWKCLRIQKWSYLFLNHTLSLSFYFYNIPHFASFWDKFSVLVLYHCSSLFSHLLFLKNRTLPRPLYSNVLMNNPRKLLFYHWLHDQTIAPNAYYMSFIKIFNSHTEKSA